MKALVVRQPWASLIAQGIKRIEIRPRRTSHRGDLLIVAGKTLDESAGQPPILSHNVNALPLGKVVCVVDLTDCVPLGASHARGACVESPGEYGHWAWVLGGVRPVEPFAVRGMPGMFEVTFAEPLAGKSD